MLKKGRIFFSWSPTYVVCVVKRGFVEPCKMILCSKIPCLGWISRLFTRFFLPKNVCWTSASKLILELRFLRGFFPVKPSWLFEIMLTVIFTVKKRDLIRAGGEKKSWQRQNLRNSNKLDQHKPCAYIYSRSQSFDFWIYDYTASAVVDWSVFQSRKKYAIGCSWRCNSKS
jgi:hypothetical protein